MTQKRPSSLIESSERSVPAFENQVKILLATFFLLTAAPIATHAQLSSAGTIIVYTLTQDKVAIAADSRGKIPDMPGHPPDDTNCKITAFNNQFVFSAAGTQGYTPVLAIDSTPQWDNMTEAARAVHLHQSESYGSAVAQVTAIAETWSSTIKMNWQFLYFGHRNVVMRAAEIGQGVLTTGIFAGAKNGEVALAIREIRFYPATSTVGVVSMVCPLGVFCATGKTDVFIEFSTGHGERAEAERKNWAAHLSTIRLLEKVGPELLQAVRFAELVKELDSSGTVGGEIDALELRKNGGIYWYQLKDNCKKTQE
jgi:hypothetical protein